jgi:uncharacterized membrane protein
MPVARGRGSSALWRLNWVCWLTLFGQQVTDAALMGLPAVIWVGKLLPLLLFVPGMLRDRLRSFIWLCFVSLGYFVAAVERVFATPQSALALLGLCAVVVLFTASMVYVRLRGPELRASAAVAAGDSPDTPDSMG